MAGRVALTALLSACAVYALSWPTGLEPRLWSPSPAMDLRAEPATGEGLARAAVGTVFADARGSLLAGLNDGRFIRVNDGVTVSARAPGSPRNCRTLSPARLLCVIANGGGMVIGDEAPLPLANLPRNLSDLAVGTDGTIYFSEASARPDNWAAFVEHANDGRVLRYDDLKSAATLVADGLGIARGLALAPDGSFLLVSEAAEYRVTKLGLQGAGAGTRTPFIENLPGFPAGIRGNGRGGFWLALYAPRIAVLDALASRPFLRELMFRLPRALQPKPEPRSWALELDGNGRVLRALSFNGNYGSALEHEGALYLSGPLESGVLRIPLRPVSVAPSLAHPQ